MQVTFTFAPSDFNRYFRAQFGRMIRAAVPALIVMSVLLNPGTFIGVFSLSTIIWTIAPVTLIFLVAFAAFPWIIRRRTYQNPLLAGPQTVAIGPDGVAWSGALFATRYAWAAVARIRQDASTIYIVLKSQAVVFVPKRAFATPPECAIFVDTAQAYFRGDPVPVVVDDGSWPPPPGR